MTYVHPAAEVRIFGERGPVVVLSDPENRFRNHPGHSSQKSHGRRGGAGTGRDITDDATMRDVYGETTGDDGQWSSTDDGDKALFAIAARQGFDGPPEVVPSARFDSFVREGGHTPLHRGLKATEDMTAAEIHAETREGRYRPGVGMFGNGYYMAPDLDKAAPFSDGTPGSLGRYALNKDARTITFTEIRGKYGEIADSPGFKRTSEKAAIIADYGRLAASLGFDAIHVEAGTPMLGGGTVGRTEYVVLNRTALIAEGS